MTKKILIDEAVVKQALEWIEDAAVVLSHTSTAIQGGLGAEAEGVGGCSVKVLKELRGALEVNNKGVNALAEQQAAEPVGEGSERQFALREAHRSHFADQYFKVRPQIDFLGNRRLFESGFDRGWDAKQIPASASPVSAGWYCAHCQRGVDPSEVTYNEAHTECGRIITDDVAPPPAPAQQDGTNGVVALQERLRQKPVALQPLADDTARLNWLNQNFFADEKDKWDQRQAPDCQKWKFFAPNSVQGDIRRVIDAAITGSKT